MWYMYIDESIHQKCWEDNDMGTYVWVHMYGYQYDNIPSIILEHNNNGQNINFRKDKKYMSYQYLLQ